MNEQRADNIFQVKSFTEKPEEQFAKMFIESHEFLWNTGLFLWGARTFLETIRQVSSEVSDILQRVHDMLSVGENIPTLIQQAFSICPNIPLETGVLEKVDNVDVMQCDFGWSDLGTWTQVFNIMQKTEDGNVVLTPTEDQKQKQTTFFYDTSDCIIKLPKGKIATIQNLHGYAIIDTPDILMICKKDDQQSIRNFVNDVTLRSQQDS
jgi:mannose-1-phosphate guanylyltransferase